MTRPRGLRIGAYEIQALIGVGGMGEVYRARDTRLGREIAIKFLPEELTADADRRARFEREARVLASLNHSNIAAIYGVEDASDGALGLVLELVEGPTLAERLLDGPFPVPEALGIAAQIAAALAAAHEVSIVHRDLKPQNIKLKPDGVVKVLDFGLAKTFERASSGEPRSLPPTVTSDAITRIGTVLGTPAYMSPEQTRGGEIDKRADVWAFGCVLYELLTGRLAFAGDDVSDTIAAVRRSEPDWNAFPPDVPASVLMLLRRCLEKDPARRLRDLGDARLLIEDSAPPRETARTDGRRSGAHARRRRGPIAAFASAGAVALVVVAVALYVRSLPERGLEIAPSAAPPAETISAGAAVNAAERLPNSIAVLPLDSLSLNRDDAYFAAGLHEQILHQLTQLRRLNVTSRTSVLRYAENRPPIPEIAEQLRVETVMEGSVQYAGNEFMVTTQLIDAATDAHLWSETFRADRSNIEELFAIQTDIATNIARALGTEITSEDRGRIDRMPTESASAYDHYLRAQDYATRAEFGDAFRELDAAIEQDPGFAEAYAQRAYYYAYSQITSLGRSLVLRDNEALRGADFGALATADADRALELYDRAGHAWLARAMTHLFHFRYREAGDAFARALAASPNDPTILGEYGMFRSYVGDLEGARELILQAERYDPNGAITLAYVGQINGATGRPAEAAAAFAKGLRLNPDDVNHNVFGAVSAPDWATAERRLRTLERLASDYNADWALVVASVAYRRYGRDPEADAALMRYAEWATTEGVGAGDWAQYYFVRGDLERMGEQLEAAVETLEGGRADAGFFALQRLLSGFNTGPDPLLAAPPFPALLDRLKALTTR